MLRIALPNKGRLADDVRQLLDDAGYPSAARSDRALTATLGDQLEALFVRAQDIPELLADGAADAGVTGWDLVCESGRDLAQVLDLSFGRCRLVVAAREESGIGTLAQLPPGARVATCFPRLTARFFARRDLPIEVVPMSGAVEAAPHLGIADFVADLSSTGSTLKANGLREIGTILDSTAWLMARPGLSVEPLAQLEELSVALSSVLRARQQRYLMANAPRAALARIREVLPGLSGPTVIDVMDGGALVAVHAVVATEAINRTVARLRALGAQGILVTRIERSLP